MTNGKSLHEQLALVAIKHRRPLQYRARWMSSNTGARLTAGATGTRWIST